MKRIVQSIGVLLILAVLLSACGPTPEPEVIVETVEVEKIVTEVVMETVKETVIVEGTPEVVEKEVTKVVEVEKVVTATPEPELSRLRRSNRITAPVAGPGRLPARPRPGRERR